MERKQQSFGEFISEKRKNAPGQITLADMAERLGISLSFLSDIERGRKKPFDGEKLAIFARETHLSEEDTSKLYDLAARDKNSIPSDIENTFMYSEAGDLARLALRKTKSGEITVEDWKIFIQQKEEKGN